MAEITLEAASGDVPGKLMISGEYAVLDGQHPAVAIAVGCVARWTLHGLTPPGLVRVEAFERVFEWCLPAQPPAGIATVVATAVTAAEAHGWPLRHRLTLRIHGQVGGVKVGLGTSAASVVATLRACRASSGGVDRDGELAQLAHDVHVQIQDGKGSGYDIGTIAAGGCVAYDARSRATTKLQWPKQLHGAALFTGEAANTRLAINKTPSKGALSRIGTASEALLQVWNSGAGTPLLRAIGHCQRVFDDAVAEGTMLRSDAVTRTCRWIINHGGVPRVSGAGGGDCVLAFSDDRAQLDALIADWRTQGGVCVARLPDDMHSYAGGSDGG